MFVNGKFAAFFACAALAAMPCAAGDVANFVDLGFSPDGSIYVFGEYGVTGSTLQPWAALSVVDVAKNDFLRGGQFFYRDSEKIAAGQDGEGALFALIGGNPEITAKFGVNYLRQGVPLYLSLSDTHFAEGEVITFRDFVRGSSYKASLEPTVGGEGGKIWSSFYITVERTDSSGETRTWKTGTPSIKRAGVETYSIKRVSLESESDAIVFVVEMKLSAPSGHDIRYMVETLKF